MRKPRKGARGTQRTLEALDIFRARRVADRPVTEILHQTTFLDACVLLLYNRSDFA
jgi:hypothetical protein